MKVIIAMDSFKGSMSSMEAGNAAAAGIQRVFPKAEIKVCPLADGGEGTMEALTIGMGGKIEKVSVTGPMGGLVNSSYGIVKNDKLAIIEMAKAAGITLVNRKERNPLFATTYGVGEMIQDALDKGCRHFLIGIGGSATNDGGVGMLQALGFSFLDKNGKEIQRGAIGLANLNQIRTDKIRKELKDATFDIACDVTNPLCGKEGCSTVYGPQKGADEQMVMDMDNWMQKYAELSRTINQNASANFPGAGAAGGMGFAFCTFLDGVLKSGVELVIEKSGLEEKIQESDLVITGEGCLDAQSMMGKAPIGAAKLAKKYEKPVIAFAGGVTDKAFLCNENFIDAFFSAVPRVMTLEEAMKKENAENNLSNCVEQAFRLISIMQNRK